jgi:hypothetical protein
MDGPPYGGSHTFSSTSTYPPNNQPHHRAESFKSEITNAERFTNAEPMVEPAVHPPFNLSENTQRVFVRFNEPKTPR